MGAVLSTGWLQVELERRFAAIVTCLDPVEVTKEIIFGNFGAMAKSGTSIGSESLRRSGRWPVINLSQLRTGGSDPLVRESVPDAR